jgi:hypothetical protein
VYSATFGGSSAAASSASTAASSSAAAAAAAATSIVSASSKGELSSMPLVELIVSFCGPSTPFTIDQPQIIFGRYSNVYKAESVKGVKQIQFTLPNERIWNKTVRGIYRLMSNTLPNQFATDEGTDESSSSTITAASASSSSSSFAAAATSSAAAAAAAAVSTKKDRRTVLRQAMATVDTETESISYCIEFHAEISQIIVSFLWVDTLLVNQNLSSSWDDAYGSKDERTRNAKSNDTFLDICELGLKVHFAQTIRRPHK